MSYTDQQLAFHVRSAMPETFHPLKGVTAHAAADPVVKASQELNSAAVELGQHVNKTSALREKFTAVADAHKAVRAHEVLKDGKYIAKEGLDDAAKTAYASAKSTLEKAKSAAKEAIKVTEGSPDVFKKFADAHVGAQKFTNKGALTGGITSGRVRALGVGGALKDNLWNAEHKGMSGVRIAGVGAGLYMAKGALRSQTSDGQDRSMITRFAQLAAGLGIAGFSALGGAAR